MPLIFVVIVVVVVAVFLFYFPVRTVVLGEGIFRYSKKGTDFFTETTYKLYYLKYPCRHCWVERIRPFTDIETGNDCYIAVPIGAINLSYEPAGRDTIKIVAKTNLFGRVVLYRILPTTYGEEFSAREGIELGRDHDYIAKHHEVLFREIDFRDFGW